MHLQKATYLPKLNSPPPKHHKTHFHSVSHTTLNYFNINFNNNNNSNNISNINHPNNHIHNKTSFRFGTPFKNNYSHFSPSKTFRNKTKSCLLNQNITPIKQQKFISKQSKYTSPKIKLSSLALAKQSLNLSNNKECPLCHHVIESYRFNFHKQSHPSRILPWLYLGSYKHASDKNDLKRLNINYVLNCAVECVSHYGQEIKYKHLKLNDFPMFNILSHLDTAVDFIQEAKDNGGNILVHCQMGISRSTSCVMAYLINKMNYNTLEAFNFIRKKRKIVCPNYGFFEQLLIYEKKFKREE